MRKRKVTAPGNKSVVVHDIGGYRPRNPGQTVAQPANGNLQHMLEGAWGTNPTPDLKEDVLKLQPGSGRRRKGRTS